MSKHFKVLGFLASSFPQIALDTICAAAIAKTDIFISRKDSRYTLSMVGVDMCFTVLCDDAIIDSIMSLPNESTSDYASRIIALIHNYS